MFSVILIWFWLRTHESAGTPGFPGCAGGDARGRTAGIAEGDEGVVLFINLHKIRCF
jgi:hypothetical protein